jgi:hypothetical protein
LSVRRVAASAAFGVAALLLLGPQLGAQAAPVPTPSAAASTTSAPTTPPAPKPVAPARPTATATPRAVSTATPKAQPKPKAAAPIVPDLVLALPPDSGEEGVLPLGPDEDGDFEAILTNTGAAAAASTLTITLPVGLTVDQEFGVYRDDQYLDDDDDGGVQLDCTTVSASTITCVLGAVAGGANTLLDIPVTPTPAAVVGTVGRFTVGALADTGLDADPADNTVSASVLFAGIAHIKATLSSPTTRVVVGKSIKVTATISNAGPQPALNASGFVGLEATHFTITGFTGTQLGLESPTVVRDAAAVHADQKVAAGAKKAPIVTTAGVQIVLWDAGTIAAGRSISAVITLRAVSPGRDLLALLSGSDAEDPPCEDFGSEAACQNTAELALTAIAVPPKPSHSASPNSRGQQLADTGPARVGRLTIGSILTVLLGALLLAIGTRRQETAEIG